MGNICMRLMGTHEMKKYPETSGKFEDGIRTVDFVLAYNGNDSESENAKKRKIFEGNLVKEGLQLERDSTQRIHFLKIHAPLEVLYKYAEILKIKLPMKTIPGQDKIVEKRSSFISKSIRNIIYTLHLKRTKFPLRPYQIYCIYTRNYHDLFLWEDKNFLSVGVRNSIVNFILERQYFHETDENVGIGPLLQDHVYDSAFTLHGENDRDLLLREWANLRKLMTVQPLDNINDYCGPQVTLYYAWLGFYTIMLIPLSIVGILSVMYGLITLKTDKLSTEICNDKNTTLMCPLCDRDCDFWQLEDICQSAKMNYLVDNSMTVIFAFITSLWAVLYLELWKRYSARLVHRWGLTGFSQSMEQPRMQHLKKIRQHKKFANNEADFEVPFWKTHFLMSFTSYSILFLFMCIALLWTMTMIIYRMALKSSHSILGGEDAIAYKIMIYPMTVGIVGFTAIWLLNYVFQYLSPFLTNLEYCRTKAEYEESLTIKSYIFSFVNYYSWLFYIAFLKGKFVGYPAKYNRILGLRQQECSPGGCLMELCMQLAITLMWKQVLSGVKEMTKPYIKRTYRRLVIGSGLSKRPEDKLEAYNQWTEDYHLLEWGRGTLYVEYLEMAIQFGLITLFGLAFPLAPLFALINNVVEIRLDALKMLRFYQRPVAQRAINIGVWYNLLLVITKIAVASNAMIIAFSTNLVPKIIYRITTNDYSLEGYLNFTLAYFNTADFESKPMLDGSRYENATSCRYTEFRNPPWDNNPYKRPMIYWKILAARLAFIVIFQNVIFMIQGIIAWAIPDVPYRLLKRIRREDSLLLEHIIEYEKDRAGQKARMAAFKPAVA